MYANILPGIIFGKSFVRRGGSGVAIFFPEKDHKSVKRIYIIQIWTGF